MKRFALFLSTALHGLFPFHFSHYLTAIEFTFFSLLAFNRYFVKGLTHEYITFQNGQPHFKKLAASVATILIRYALKN